MRRFRMISGRMRRPARVLPILTAVIGLAALAAGCGTAKISVPKTNQAAYRGAVLFSERCGGCHTLSYAATYGSASNPRHALRTNGPNFDQRCERPITRVLYAIENGGFSGAIMPQNVVVGQDAIDVAKFVSMYSGTKEPKVVGVVPCSKEPIGSLPPGTPGLPATSATSATAAAPTAPTATTASSSTSTASTRTKTKSSKHKSKP